MKRTSLFHSIVFASLLILASCGSDNSMSGKPTNSSSNSSSLTGSECACNASYSPVCGVNQNGVSISYDNSCIASCYKATNVVSGNCECSEATRVCGVDGKDYTECEARYYRVTVKKYGTCSGGSY